MSEPDELDAGAKKALLRLVPYGLYAVSATDGDQRGIFTANWLTQVSFDPPLVALSVEKDSFTLSLIRARGRFVVSFFTSEQTELARNLGRPQSKAGDKFAAFDLPVVDSWAGPALTDGLGYIGCAVNDAVDAGDSVVVIGEVVEAVAFGDGSLLSMQEAGFRHAG